METKLPSLMYLKLHQPDMFCKQDWYYDQKFAQEPIIISTLGLAIPPKHDKNYVAPSASECAYLLFTHGAMRYLFEGYLWTRDSDDEGNPVYVGGLNYGRGLQIHRHLQKVDARRVEIIYGAD